MNASTRNPAITRLLYWVTAIEAGVLLVSGGGLFFLPSVVGDWWPWLLLPFNTRFLGALYLASYVMIAGLAWAKHWDPARVAIPMIFLFTVIVMSVTLLYLDRFDRIGSTILWFILYLGIPINAGYHLWLYRNQPPPDAYKPPAWMGLILQAGAVLFALYGAALLIAPARASEFWPWALDDFHARMYSVAFLAPAVGMWLIARAAGRIELLTLGIALVANGLLPIIGMAIVDNDVKRVDWNATETYTWIALFGAIAAVGLMLVALGIQRWSAPPLEAAA